MTDEEKNPLGFATPAREIQDTIGKVLGELQATKTNWEALIVDLNGMLEKALQGHEKAVNLEDLDLGISLQVGFIGQAMTVMGMQIMCTVGTQLTETHERLAAVEKAVNELKLIRR